VGDESATTRGYASDASADRLDAIDDSDATARSDGDGFSRKGWVLTAALIACVLVIPGIIYAYPYVAGSFGLTFFTTYLVLPLIPAVLLGLIAIWSMSAAVGRKSAADGGDAR